MSVKHTPQKTAIFGAANGKTGALRIKDLADGVQTAATCKPMEEE